jgi:signal transduction histidine kinase
MYLHDFKNPLTAINEKILDYKDVFESILMESEEQIGTFQFGKNELDDLVFLSITSDDCLNMIKSYEDFSKAFANNDITNESMKLNLSSFYLNEITDYLHDWIHIKNQRTHQELEFIVNNIAISDHFKLCTDKLKLKQILINIISNSYKFTKDGEIILTITREKIVWNSSGMCCVCCSCGSGRHSVGGHTQ